MDKCIESDKSRGDHRLSLLFRAKREQFKRFEVFYLKAKALTATSLSHSVEDIGQGHSDQLHPQSRGVPPRSKYPVFSEGKIKGWEMV